MQTLDFLVQPGIPPRVSLAADRHFLHAVCRPARTRLGVLRVYDCAGDLLSLGRYHLAPEPSAFGDTAARLHRRHSGGRAVPFGDGFVGVTLVLPHRSALTSADPFTLAPYQVLNRYVRGVLEGCKLIGVPAFYPGRDFITVARRVIGWVSFEVDDSGALLFEAVLANSRSFSVLPQMIDDVDPGGVVTAEMLLPESTTCLTEELRTELSTEAIADAICRGFEQQFDVRCAAHTLTPLEEQAIGAVATHELADDRWLRQRRLHPDLDRHAQQRVQLGVFEAHFSLEQERFIKGLLFSGDFIANSPGIARLERELRLCPAEWRAIDAVASAVFAAPENYILGIGPVRVIADTICKGLTA